jgi:hypothetical protein
MDKGNWTVFNAYVGVGYLQIALSTRTIKKCNVPNVHNTVSEQHENLDQMVNNV